MLKTILAISGKPGLFKLVSQGKNMLIVESLATGKRTPAYAHDKVISLGDIAIYTIEEDVPLGDVLEALKTKTESKPVDIKAFEDDAAMRAYFKEVLPDFDEELLAAGLTDFAEKEEKDAAKAEEAE